jgi:hypothetical protein
MGFRRITRWRLAMGWDRLGRRSRNSRGRPSGWCFAPQGARLQDTCAVEDGSRRNRIPGDGRNRADHSGIPRGRALRDFQWWPQSQRRAAGQGGISHYQPFSVADLLAIAIADCQPVARTLAHSQDFTIAPTYAGRLSSPKARSLADSEAAAGQEHLRCAGEPLGLQLLRWPIYHQPSVRLLPSLQLHQELLD